MSPSDLSPERRAQVAADWWFRHHAEREATLRFTRLADELARVGAVEVVLTMAREACQDEARHADQCAALAATYDPADPWAGHIPEAPAIGPRDLPQRQRVLYEIVAMCCVTESINAALLTEILRVSTDDRVRRTTRDILKDEVQHARLGWAHLAAEVERQQDTAFLGPRLVPMLRDSISENLISPDAPTAGVSLEAHGLLSQAHRRAIFASTTQHVILPGLAHHGVPTAQARDWLDALPWLPPPPSTQR